jgi:hypothetical protein
MESAYKSLSIIIKAVKELENLGMWRDKREQARECGKCEEEERCGWKGQGEGVWELYNTIVCDCLAKKNTLITEKRTNFVMWCNLLCASSLIQ